MANHPTKNQFWEKRGLFRDLIPFTAAHFSAFSSLYRLFSLRLRVCSLSQAGSPSLVYVN